ncbi:MIR domain protein, partial [Ichthyophthirius multifiliis]
DIFLQKKLQERQDQLDKLNATKIVLKLFWDENENDSYYLNYLLKFLNLLLKNGNKSVQKNIFDYFQSSSNSEKLFSKINQILYSQSIQKPILNGSHKSQIIQKILRLLQLFCEGHNLFLQNYIRKQTNSKYSYDLVSLTIKLLISYQITPETYTQIEQCFDTLTEFVQGPCKENQNCIAQTKFLEYAVQVLGEDSRLYDENQKIHVGQVARLKYKCLITINSLLEFQDQKSNFIGNIMRNIPLQILTSNLTKIYILWKKYSNNDYNKDLFNNYEDEIDFKDEQNSEKYQFIIENGFFIYILIKLYISNNVFEEIEQQDDDDMNSILNEFKQEEDDGFDAYFQKNNIFGNIGKIGKGLLSVGMNALQEINSNLKQKKQQEEEEIKKEKEKKKELHEALSFFHQKTCQIEIIRDGELQTIFFPKLPLCFTLSDEVKDHFNNKVNRSSSKAKLSYLMDQSDSIILIMTHEENIRRLVNRYYLIGFIVNNHKLLENMNFLFAIVLNLIILTSYSQYFLIIPPNVSKDSPEYSNALNNSRLQDPRFLYIKEYDDVEKFIFMIGIFNLFLVCIVVSFFLLKRAPLIIGNIWCSFFLLKLKKKKTKFIFFIKNFFNFLIKIFYSIYLLLQDFDIIYYFTQLIFALLGLTYHPFLFGGLLFDFLRFDILSNVVKAIYEPKIELGLSFLLFVILEYYFTIVSYIYFYDQYPEGDCESFWKCYFKTFDYTFKETGAVGKFLKEKSSLNLVNDEYIGVNQNYKDKYFARFAFDNMLNIILVLIVINMVGGIIIDKFKELKDKLDEKNYDENKFCFICGLDRQTLDKGGDQGGFFYHIKVEHKMWNYIFYKAYLKFKQVTEYNGDESYIWSKIEKYDISWIPKKRTKKIKDQQDLEEEKINMLVSIKESVIQIKKQYIYIYIYIYIYYLQYIYFFQQYNR